MATYYVRKSGSDSNAGTSTGAAWLTVDKAASTAVAGDTVYIGAGVYYETVTNDNSGSSGSPIRFIADVTGDHTGDAGFVYVSAFGSANKHHEVEAIRATCWDLNGKTFITIRGIVMLGTKTSGGRVFTSTAAGNHSFEGVVIEQCAFVSMGVEILSYNGYCLGLDIGNGATPSGDGLIIRQCKFWGQQGVVIVHTNNASAHTNLKCIIENCEFWGERGTSVGVYLYAAASNTYSTGGVTVRGCTFYGHNQATYGRYLKNTTNPFSVYNNVFVSTVNYVFLQELGTTGALVENFNRIYQSAKTLAWSGVNRGNATTFNGMWLPGFMVDHIHRISFGYSPFAPMEPVRMSGYIDTTIQYGDIANKPASNDINGNPRAMGRSLYGNRYYFNGSTVAASGWTNSGNATDANLDTSADDGTAGDSESSGFLRIGGTNAPASGGSIVNVYARAKTWLGTGSAGSIRIYTASLGEALCAAFSGINEYPNWTDWTLLSAPTGGWTWAAVQGLECKLWFVTKSGGDYYIVYQVEVCVDTAEVAPSIGAVESNPRPIQNSTDEYEGTYCMEMNGTSQYTFWQPVSAVSTTISVQVKFDANYTGTKPQLVITNIPGVADQTDTATGSSGSYEQLSLNFTPTSAGFVRVKLVSNDTSATGKCFFDDIQVS